MPTLARRLAAVHEFPDDTASSVWIILRGPLPLQRAIQRGNAAKGDGGCSRSNASHRHNFVAERTSPGRERRCTYPLRRA